MKYKLIIFDLDGVIVDTDYYHFLSWKSISNMLHIDFNEEDNEKLRGVSRMESLDIILEKSDCVFSKKEKECFANEKNKLYQRYLMEMSKENLSQEVKTTLFKLKEKGMKLAIGSSSKNARIILEQIDLLNFFDAICDGTQISYSKPHPEVFIKAAEMLAVECKCCLVVEDAKAGCIAAKSASMKVAAISSAYNCRYADYHLNSFSDLLKVVI